jgi:hypothetical protein
MLIIKSTPAKACRQKKMLRCSCRAVSRIDKLGTIEPLSSRPSREVSAALSDWGDAE